MSIVLFALGLAFTAFYVWLGIRAINGRETWALRTAIVLLAILIVVIAMAALIMFILSSGPAKWFHSQ